MASVNRDLGNSTAYAEAIYLLMHKGGTAQEIANDSGLAYNTVRKLIRALHRRRIVRVALWRKDALGRDRLPVWLFGSQPDAAKPPGMPLHERVRRYDDKRREIAQRLGVPMRRVRLRDYPGETA